MRIPGLLILFFLLKQSPFHSQTTHTESYEFFWAISHPVAAIKVKYISKKCKKFNDSAEIGPKLDLFISGGKADAYRHVFYMAAFSQKIRVKKLRKLGKAHEKTNYRQFKKAKNEYGELPDSLSSVMDLKNNEIGFKIGSENKNLSLDRLSEKVITSIKRGEAYIVKRNTRGEYLNCKGEVLPEKSLQKKWNTDKCLVNSNYVYID